MAWASDFVALPIIFYIVIFAGGFSIDHLRQNGWVFNVGESRDPWYKFYTQFGKFCSFVRFCHCLQLAVCLSADFRHTSWPAVWETMPTQVALLFFNVLHPPLNVPALGMARPSELITCILCSKLCSCLGISLGEDEVDLNRELTGHGVSNLVAGVLGCGISFGCSQTLVHRNLIDNSLPPPHADRRATISHMSTLFCMLLPGSFLRALIRTSYMHRLLDSIASAGLLAMLVSSSHSLHLDCSLLGRALLHTFVSYSSTSIAGAKNHWQRHP